MKRWEDFNQAWLALLERQKSLSETETIRLDQVTLEHLGTKLVEFCDRLELRGLVDYQYGIWEDYIIRSKCAKVNHLSCRLIVRVKASKNVLMAHRMTVTRAQGPAMRRHTTNQHYHFGRMRLTKVSLFQFNPIYSDLWEKTSPRPHNMNRLLPITKHGVVMISTAQDG